MNLSENLSGKIVLITGSSRGIGKACAKMFAELGSIVAIHYSHDKKAAESVRNQLQSDAKIFQANLIHETECVKLIREVKTTFGRLDILVINHGIWEKAEIEKITAKDINQTIALNLTSAFFLIREAISLFPSSGGAIVLISSTAGQRGEAYYSHYAASKGGLISLTKSLAVELAPRKVRINAIAPGWVFTDMTKHILTGNYLKEVEASIPLRKVALPEDIAPAVIFLSSEYANHITGEILNVNGGSVLCG